MSGPSRHANVDHDAMPVLRERVLTVWHSVHWVRLIGDGFRSIEIRGDRVLMARDQPLKRLGGSK